ncbi:Arylsulfatase [Thalassoglobus neptunius]|uniref:Arylsulfatase n=1 Tax=Thalassoglobus neptunius TaxID=1938619 RepID=A0A5C5X0B8_9PLAN|nr:sulfatase [Thalassoglobus neptunius]TWT55603.1 Arylsulfatase [Thalassoglobus neptunius]
MCCRAIIASLMLLFSSCPLSAADDGPNFVFILVDDFGYMDIGANNPGTFYETPNIDRLAGEGVLFTQGYAANPVCSPTRYSIMTGKYPSRVDATNFFSGARSGKFLPATLNNRMPLSDVTIAEQLRDNGYRTFFLGKWHLGPTPEFWPEHQGFDVNIGGHVRGLPKSYFSPYSNPRLSDGPKVEHLTHRLADEAIKLIEESEDEKFLLYLSFYTVHTPLQAPKPLVQKYREKAAWLTEQPEFGPEEQVWETDAERKVRIRQSHPTYAAMVESLDQNVGRILDTLEELELADDTVVVLFSDNGGLSTSEGSPTSNLPLRGGKGWVYEGGIREPMIIKWPDAERSNPVCDVPVISVDFYPTILDLAGIDAPSEMVLDGVSLVPLLKGEKLPERDLFWHYPHYSNQGGFPGGAIRRGDYKLIERYEDGRTHLYNTRDDVSETTDIAADHPELVNDLRNRLHQWYKEVDAKFLRAKDGGEDPWSPDQ